MSGSGGVSAAKLASYEQQLEVFGDVKEENGSRYQAFLQIISFLESSPLAVSKIIVREKDFKVYLKVFQNMQDTTLRMPVFDLLYRLAQISDPDIRTGFVRSGFFPSLLETVKDARFTPKGIRFIGVLMEENNLVDELVEAGVVPVLLRFTSVVDKSVLSTDPKSILSTRRFAFYSLRLISRKQNHLNALFAHEILRETRENCYGLEISEQYSRHFSSGVLDVIRADETFLESYGLEILYHFALYFETFKKEIDFKPAVTLTDDEINTLTLEEIDDAMEVARSDPFKNVVANDNQKERASFFRHLFKQIVQYKLLNQAAAVIRRGYEASASFGLRTIQVFSPVISSFLVADEKLLLANNLITTCQLLSTERRNQCLLTLYFLSHELTLFPVLLETSIFEMLFYVGMEESGHTLYLLTILLQTMSWKQCTAIEIGTHSNCLKLCVKILHDDFKLQIPTLTNDEERAHAELIKTDPKKDRLPEKWDKASFKCITILGNVALALAASDLHENATSVLVDAGAVHVAEKLLEAHQSDFIGMNLVMLMSYIYGTLQPNKIADINHQLVELLYQTLEKTIKEETIYGMSYSIEELVLALRGLSRSPLNCEKVYVGLPVLLQVLKLFNSERESVVKIKAKDKQVSEKAALFVVDILQNLSYMKQALVSLVQLGGEFELLMDTVRDRFTSDDAAAAERGTNDSKLLVIDSVLLAMDDEKLLIAQREADQTKMRKSSKIRWSQVARSEGSLDRFIEARRIESMV